MSAEDWWVVITAAIPQRGILAHHQNPSQDQEFEVEALYFGPFASEDEAEQHCCEEGGSIDTFIQIDSRKEGWAVDDVYRTPHKPARAQHVAPYLTGTTEHWTKVACGLPSDQCTCSNEKED